jgi:hypothetical protein
VPNDITDFDLMLDRFAAAVEANGERESIAVDQLDTRLREADRLLAQRVEEALQRHHDRRYQICSSVIAYFEEGIGRVPVDHPIARLGTDTPAQPEASDNPHGITYAPREDAP